MCFRPTTTRRHYICLPCRAGYKKRPVPGETPGAHRCPRCRGELIDAGQDLAVQRPVPGETPGAHRCPRCRGELIDAGQDLAVPARRDTAGWKALGALLNAGVTFHSRCCDGPGWRPRHPREIRERLAAAGATGVPVRTALTTEDLDALRAPGRGPRRRRRHG
ncbi:hypothetical protein ACGFX7_14920 [Streptomyces harbinensis]|uniref:hypothetical protein n=1 Tax=Streptomyces harbinensis TaxID=1176198 RepID=UPI00371CD4F1